MKINTATKEREMQGVSLSVDYGIQMGAKAYHVLQDGMYSDIISTIVRELSSNAYDAHIAAGKADEPFHVFCPSAFDPDFAVKDNGTGLRYYKYKASITNEREGESTLFIQGDVRDQIQGITKAILDKETVVNFNSDRVLFDHKTQETVIRVAGNYDQTEVDVEFDDCIVLWTTYFASTKDDSDDFIGGWGLGSKTPNAYVDNYVVINRFNGIKRTYNVSVSEIGMPQINLMFEEETNESNGLEVRLAVDPSDYSEFKEAIKSQLRYFDPQPIVHNEEIEFPKIIHKGEHFILMENNIDEYGWRQAPVCVGNNAYSAEVSTSLLQNNENIVMLFKVGEVSVTASREELKYDERVREVIRKREDETVAEYRQFVLDSINLDDMTDYEKADFLNTNHQVLDLSDEKVRQAVGNPHYVYDSNQISIPLGGWGDFTNLQWRETFDEYGNVNGHSLSRYDCRIQRALRWSSYARGMKKAESTQAPLIKPGEKVLVFLRDTTYSYLKRIKMWLDDIDTSGTHYKRILLADGGEFDSLDNIKPYLNGNVTFVRMSDIELPKVQRGSVSYSATPVARIFDFDRAHTHNYIRYPKYWQDDYTPLTKLDKTNAYVMEHHRGESQMKWEETDFFHSYLSSGLPLDRTVKIYALPTAKYCKALEYGFKPLSELIEECRNHVAVPVGYSNYEMLHKHKRENFNRTNVLDMIRSKDTIAKLDKDNPVRMAYRLLKITNWMMDRYEDAWSSAHSLVDMETANIPEASDIVKKVVAMSDGLCNNINQSMTLISDISYWNFNGSEKQEALADYINWVFNSNTGENDE